MSNARLLHDCAFATAMHVVEVLRELQRDGKLDEAFTHVYARVKAGMECLQVQADRMQKRLRPGKN
jgi:hypothetical protein